MAAINHISKHTSQESTKEISVILAQIQEKTNEAMEKVVLGQQMITESHHYAKRMAEKMGAISADSEK